MAMDKKQLSTVVKALVDSAENYRDDRQKDRTDALDYYNGKMRDVPEEEGRSKVVSHDVRKMCKRAKPAIMRVLLGTADPVEYKPVGPEDIDTAKQASDYINRVVLPECKGELAIEDAIHDAIRLRNGYLTWYVDEMKEVKVSHHSGLSSEEAELLAAEDDVEVLEQDVEMVQVTDDNGETQSVPSVSMKIKRTESDKKIQLDAFPDDEYLIHPDAKEQDSSPIVGRACTLPRSDLVAMGYDKESIWALPVAGSDTEDDDEKDRDYTAATPDDDRSSTDKAMELVDYYVLYVRVDADEDGIAELRRIVYAGGVADRYLLENDYTDEVPIQNLKIERQPHQWEGRSLADDTMEGQKVKTVLLQETLNNLYWQNNLRPWYQEGAILNPEAIHEPQFGKPILVEEGTDGRAALGYDITPFVAKESFAMLEYWDRESEDRTGITEMSAGLPDNALQNVTAKASAMVEQAAIGNIEEMTKTIASGLETVFKGLLKLTIQHQDKERTIYLRGDWVSYDPRQWNADMNAEVKTGLGAGTRERDMAMMRVVMGIQKDLLAGFGPDNPFVKPDNLWNALAGLSEAAGLRSPELYFTHPDEAEVQQKLQDSKNKPDPAITKIQEQMKLELVKAQSSAAKEKAQMEADLRVKMAEAQAKSQAQMQELQNKLTQAQMNNEMERQRMENQFKLDMAALENERDIALIKMGQYELSQQDSLAENLPPTAGFEPGGMPV